MGRILKTYSRKHSKYKTKQPISVRNRDLYNSIINVFHSTSQDTFDKLLKKDKIDEDTASIITQPVYISQISDSSRHFFTHGFDFMKNKMFKNSETESSSSVLFKDPYSLVNLDKRRKTKKKVKERNATRKIKRKMLSKRKPLKDIQNVNLRSEDKSINNCAKSTILECENLQNVNLRSKDRRRQSEMKCFTSSSTPLIGKLPSNHAVIPLSPIVAVKKTLFHDEMKNDELSKVGKDSLSRKLKIESFPYFTPCDLRQDKYKMYSGEESNFTYTKIDNKEKNDMNHKGSNQESKINQQVNSPDFFTYFIDDKNDSVVSEYSSASSKKTYNIKQDKRDLESVSDLEINKQLKQLSLSSSDREFSDELFEDKVEKESSKEHNKLAQNQTFGNNNYDYLIITDNILTESQELYKKENSGNYQEDNNISCKTLECENCDEWKPIKCNHEISKNQSKKSEIGSMKLKQDVKENSEDIGGHITNTKEVEVNKLTENSANDREQDSYITLQPGKQWRRSLLIHRRNRGSLLSVRSEDFGSRFSVQPEQIIKVALNVKYSINRRDSSSDFLYENVEKAWKCERFNLKSDIIKEEEETDASIDSSASLSSKFISSKSESADVKSHYSINEDTNAFNSSMFVKNFSVRKRLRGRTHLEEKAHSDSTNCLINYGIDYNHISVHDENTIPDDSPDEWRKSFSFNSESGFLGFSSEIINTDTVFPNGVDNERDLRTHSVCAGVLECNDDQPVDVQKLILDICEQDRLIPFEEFLCGREQEECRKLGEGTYGEVFLLHGEDESVLKVIPVEGKVIVNGEKQKTFLEIFSEMIISKQLSKLRYGIENNTQNFCYVKHIWCVQGRYPDRLKELWEIYNEKNGSENDSLEIFEDDQKYIALELNNGGTPVLSFSFSSARQAFSIFLQTVFALTVAENSCEFEHRDLHSGNLLINRCKMKQIHCRIDSVDFNIPTCGVQATIIDYTLSRINCNGTVLFNDLSKDPEMFQGVGDYQFDIYRIMREDVNSDWSEYAPVTNIRWLHYLLDKILQKVNKNSFQQADHVLHPQRRTFRRF